VGCGQLAIWEGFAGCGWERLLLLLLLLLLLQLIAGAGQLIRGCDMLLWVIACLLQVGGAMGEARGKSGAACLQLNQGVIAAMLGAKR